MLVRRNPLISEQQITLVQSSFKDIAPIADVAAELFYARLFELDPTLRPMFRGDMKEQGRKLMQMLSVAVNGLNSLDKIVPAIQDLGKRHVGYGVREKDYQTVGAALLWTLEQGLGNNFTPDVKEAWTAVYTLVATTAMEAGYSKN
jgi:hemoglobin-like flavoprotein